MILWRTHKKQHTDNLNQPQLTKFQAAMSSFLKNKPGGVDLEKPPEFKSSAFKPKT